MCIRDRTKNDAGLIIPVVITVYADRSFSFITKTPPAAVLIKKACNIESGSGVPNKTKVATISKEDVRKIAETKMPDLNAASIESAMSLSLIHICCGTHYLVSLWTVCFLQKGQYLFISRRSGLFFLFLLVL